MVLSSFFKGKIIFLFLLFSFNLLSQENKYVGEYHLELINTDKNAIKYWLTLNPDKSFFFHSYTYNKNGSPTIINKYGKGVWSAKGMVLSFITNKTKDIDEKHSLDFTNSKARFITKHQRDKTPRLVKTRIKFFESKIPWILKTELFKL